MFNENLLDRGNIPETIITVLETIGNKGFHVVIVGGAVRDLLMGKIPIEYDLASNACPDDIENLFENTLSIGKKFGTIIIQKGGHDIEITTYRKEGNYIDSRHPSEVDYSSSILDDLKRRDFTMNAMAYNPISNEFFDEFNGLSHLKERRLVSIGDPIIRFTEDSLRPFRSFRFMAQLGCIVDPPILIALEKLIDIPLPSMERIRKEIDRLLLSPFWLSAINVMDRTGWLTRIISNESELPRDIEIPRELLYRWAWLLSFSRDSDMPEKLLFSKKDIQYMNLIRHWNYDPDIVDLSVSDLNVSSEQLISLGFNGKNLGDLQNRLLDLVRKGELSNSEQHLLNYSTKLVQKN